jgi:hypothetical protein
MSELLRLAVFLSVPILIFGGLLWFLIYSAIRMALRHEISRAQRRKGEARPDDTNATPQVKRPRPVAVRADGQPTRLRPAAHNPVASRGNGGVRKATSGQRRAVS